MIRDHFRFLGSNAPSQSGELTSTFLSLHLARGSEWKRVTAVVRASD
jgi:hypothetical protein